MDTSAINYDKEAHKAGHLDRYSTGLPHSLATPYTSPTSLTRKRRHVLDEDGEVHGKRLCVSSLQKWIGNLCLDQTNHIAHDATPLNPPPLESTPSVSNDFSKPGSNEDKMLRLFLASQEPDKMDEEDTRIFENSKIVCHYPLGPMTQFQPKLPKEPENEMALVLYKQPILSTPKDEDEFPENTKIPNSDDNDQSMDID
ncbi:hypothetical protein H4219_000805 [Mycoemilia scoparia]|uniref:Uncharacterized protein n=1 Tax=Mycoemilia scoparia TaxID=417184 RepID=A0A9W8A243_9FUNG|nr:hypothetical protein H4219_000805 [Mycoemilia scoparia]